MPRVRYSRQYYCEVIFLIKVKNLSKTYNKIKAVDNISFDVKCGEVFGIIGRNGAGKTTLINMIMGLVKPDVCNGTNQQAPNGAMWLVPHSLKKYNIFDRTI